MKQKKIVFEKEKKKFFFYEKKVRIELIEKPHTLGICGIGVKSEGLSKFNLLLFRISLHQGRISHE